MYIPEYHSLGTYILRFFPTMQFADHHEKLIETLMAVEEGKKKRVIISLPPRHGKSLITSEHFPAWYLGRNPSKQFVIATYGQTLSEGFGRKVKAQVKSDEYKAIFPNCKIREDSATSNRIETKTRGIYTATSVGGALTGKGADCLIIDDPVRDRQQAESEVQRESIWNWYASVARTRLMPEGAIVVVQTRWHEDDLTGRILTNDEEDEWEVLVMPAISDDNKALWPEMFDLQALLSIRKDIGGYEFQALYQNDPKPAEGYILPVKHIRYYKQAEAPKWSRVIQIWDTAIKEGKQNDWSVCTTIGLHNGNLHEIDQWRGKVPYPELKKMAVANFLKHKPSVVVIEDKASGQQLIQELAAQMPIKAAKAVTDKVERAGTLSDLMAVGRIYLIEGEDRNNRTVSEMASFPNGSFDDIVDTWSYGAMELIRAEILPLIGDLYKEERHTLRHEGLPPHVWTVLRSMHYNPFGSSACIWWAVADSRADYAGKSWVDGAIVVIGVKQWDRGSTPEEMANRIRAEEAARGLLNVSPGPAGAGGDGEMRPDEGPGPTYAMAKFGVKFIKAIEDEPEGWAQIRSRLYDGTLTLLEGCDALTQQIQFAVSDPKQKDHVEPGQQLPALHALRYVCRAFRRRPKADQTTTPNTPSWRKQMFGI